MNKQLRKAVKKYAKLQDVFATTKHQERKAIRLQWKSVDLDAEPTPKDFKSIQEEVRKWRDLQAPTKIGKDYPKPSAYQNDTTLSNLHGNLE